MDVTVSRLTRARAILLFLVLVTAPLLSQSPGPPSNLRVTSTSTEDGAPQSSRMGDHDYYPGDFSRKAILGNSLPGSWRPFGPDSPWNRTIPDSARVHRDSDRIMAEIRAETDYMYLVDRYSAPVWVVNSDNIPGAKVRSDHIFDFWDRDYDGWTDARVPVTAEMWPEPTEDGHIIILDPFKKLSWEMSTYQRRSDGTFYCSTFNIWELDGSGVGDPREGYRWGARGGRGSGFPVIAGMIRPEELEAGEIRHALVFTYRRNRKADNGDAMFMWPPAARSDGKYKGAQYPIEGMLFQLDPSLTEADFDRWGLNREGKIVARALQKYGMYLGDNGGAMALLPQLLGPNKQAHMREWERRFPGFYETIKRIPVHPFRIVDTGVRPYIKD